MLPHSLYEDDAHLLIDGNGIENRLLKHLRSLQNWYAAELERRLKDLAEILNAELQSQVEEIRKQYEERSQGMQKESGQQPRGQTSVQQVFDEILRSEKRVAQCSTELERLVPDDSIALGKVLQIRTEQLEMKAYIRGLRFLNGIDLKPSRDTSSND